MPKLRRGMGDYSPPLRKEGDERGTDGVDVGALAETCTQSGKRTGVRREPAAAARYRTANRRAHGLVASLPRQSPRPFRRAIRIFCFFGFCQFLFIGLMRF